MGDEEVIKVVTQDAVGMVLVEKRVIEASSSFPSIVKKKKPRRKARWGTSLDPTVRMRRVDSRKRNQETGEEEEGLEKREYKPRAAKGKVGPMVDEVLPEIDDEDDPSLFCLPRRKKPLPGPPTQLSNLRREEGEDDGIIYEETEKGVMVFVKESHGNFEGPELDPFGSNNFLLEPEIELNEEEPLDGKLEISMEIGKEEDLPKGVWSRESDYLGESSRSESGRGVINELRNDNSNHLKRNLACGLCNYRGMNIECLKFHVLTHISGGPKEGDGCRNAFSCGHCSYTSNSARNMGRHSAAKHFPTEPLFFCNQCSYVGSKEAVLKAHLIAVHLGGKPYACGLCNCCFSSPVTLQSHMRKHEMWCQDCGVFFASPRKLIEHQQRNNCSIKMHMLRHSSNLSYICKYCPKRFLSRNLLISHQLIKHGGQQLGQKQPVLMNQNASKPSEDGREAQLRPGIFPGSKESIMSPPFQNRDFPSQKRFRAQGLPREERHQEDSYQQSPQKVILISKDQLGLLKSQQRLAVVKLSPPALTPLRPPLYPQRAPRPGIPATQIQGRPEENSGRQLPGMSRNLMMKFENALQEPKFSENLAEVEATVKEEVEEIL